MKVLVIIPTYNEAGNVERMLPTILGLNGAQAKHVYEVLVADDTSPDGTADIVRKLQKKHTGIHLLMGTKQGLGKAYQRAFDHALKISDADVYVQMDCDFSHDPSDLPRLIDAIDAGADVAVGSRFVHGGMIPGDWPFIRVINTKVANFVARNLGGINANIRDLTAGFRAMRRRALEVIDFGVANPSGYAIQPFLTNQLVNADMKIVEVPIAFHDREVGTSKIRMKDIANFFSIAFGLNPDSALKQIMRFMLVGLSGIAVNLTVLELVQSNMAYHPAVASLLAIEASVISNFMLHSIFTFKESMSVISASDKLPVRFVKYHGAVLLGISIQFVVAALIHFGFGVYYPLAQIIGIAAGFGANYYVSSRYVWRAALAVA